MVEFLRKFENRGTKIAGVNSILITKSINLQLFTLILCGVIVLCDRSQFSAPAQFIYREVYEGYLLGYLEWLRSS